MTRRLPTFDDFRIGQQGSFSKTITEADIGHFVAITGDVNPLHVDDEFARRSFFGSRIAHGLLSASLFSTLVGMVLPGTGAIYRSQSLEFLRPVRLGDTLTATFEIDGLDPAGNRIEMAASINNQHGETVIRGRAVAGLIRQEGEDDDR